MKKLAIAIEGFILSLIAVKSAFAQQITNIVVSPPVNLKIVDPGKLISGLIGLILIVSALAAFLYLVLGGIRWITSGGDKAGVDAARNQIQAALLGLLIVFAAWALMILLQSVLGITILGGGGFSIPTLF